MAQPVQPNDKAAMDIVGGNNAQTTPPQSRDNATVNQTNKTEKTTKTKSVPAHYLLKVEGTALIAGKETEYSVELRVPDLGEGKGDGHYMTFVLSPDNGELLFKAIAKKYKSCESIRLHSLVDRVYVDSTGKAIKSAPATASGESLTVSNMRLNELLDYVTTMKYPINTELYNKADTLREAVILYQKDREAFLAKQTEDENNYRIQQEASMLNDL